MQAPPDWWRQHHPHRRDVLQGGKRRGGETRDGGPRAQGGERQALHAAPLRQHSHPHCRFRQGQMRAQMVHAPPPASPLLEELFGLQVERTLTRRDAIIMAKVGVLLIIVVVVVIIIVVLVAAAASAATTAVTAASAGR